MDIFARLQFGGFLVFLGIISAAHGLHDINATEVSSCTETKDGVEYVAQRANDGDPTTCAKTCFQTGAWIRVPNKSAGKVNKLQIKGFMPKYTQILIGNNASDIEFREMQSSNNAPCILQTTEATDPNKALIDYTYQCTVARTGDIISFKAADIDTSPQLILCEVNPSFDANIVA